MTCTAPCTAPAPHTQKPAPHLHRTGCVLSPYNPLRCVQGCTASRRLAGTLYALVASRDETDSRAAPPRAEIWPTSVTCPRCTVRRRRPSIAARFSVGFAARSWPRTSRCYRQARSSNGRTLARAPIGTMPAVLLVASVSAKPMPFIPMKSGQESSSPIAVAGNLGEFKWLKLRSKSRLWQECTPKRP